MTIAVAFICDEGYVMPTGVAIQSLMINAPEDPEVDYDIYILGVGISEQSKNILTSMSQEGFKIQVLDCALNEKQRQITNYGRHVVPTAIMKFELPELLPQYDKVLYLDSDILVLGSLVELFQTDISSVYAGVVKDYMASRDFAHLNFLEFKQEFYFNSGVMLMNLQKMREDNMPEKLLDYRIHGKNLYMDQDALNVVLEGNVRFLSPYYNVFTSWYVRHPMFFLSLFYQTDLPKTREKVYANATILHFGEWKKPWMIDKDYLTGLYYMYYKLSPFADQNVMHMSYRLTDKIGLFRKGVRRVIGRKIMRKKGIR